MSAPHGYCYERRQDGTVCGEALSPDGLCPKKFSAHRTAESLPRMPLASCTDCVWMAGRLLRACSEQHRKQWEWEPRVIPGAMGATERDPK